MSNHHFWVRTDSFSYQTKSGANPSQFLQLAKPAGFLPLSPFPFPPIGEPTEIQKATYDFLWKDETGVFAPWTKWNGRCLHIEIGTTPHPGNSHHQDDSIFSRESL